jgi:hypothetical protein
VSGLLLDVQLNAASRALAAGDALAALNCVALRDDAPSLALRGIAMAQLNDLDRARKLLRRAARAFGPREIVARARCLVAEAEIALVSRDLTGTAQGLDSAASVLQQGGDRANAAHAGYLAIRRLALIGRLEEAERRMQSFDAAPLAAASRAAYCLVACGVAARRLRAAAARDWLQQAETVARQTRIASLLAEVGEAARRLEQPAARLIAAGQQRLLRLDDVEALLASSALVIDARRMAVRRADLAVALATRPVLFGLARALAEAWPGAATRETLLARAFRARDADESHRARLRVEIGRLRKALAGVAGVRATRSGFALVPAGDCEVAVLAPPTQEPHAEVLALLGDGEAWSSSALALALGVSPRTVQRALEELAGAGRAQPLGRGRARRWMAPPSPGFPTSLLLSVAPPAG